MATLRPALLEDDGRLLEIDRAVWSPLHSPALAAPEPGGTTFHPPRVTVSGTLVAAGEDDVAVGWIAIHQPIPQRSAAHVREVSGLAVHPSAQGQGVGRLLLGGAAALAREQGATRLTLRCLATNAPGIALYERFGFTLEGRLRGEFLIGGSPVDDLLYAIDIGHTAGARP